MGGGGEHLERGKEILTHPFFKGIAEKHDCSTGVLALSWAVQRGVCVIPKSSSPTRLIENIKLVELSDSEMQEINEAHKNIVSIRLADGIKGNRQVINGQDTLLGWTKQDFGWEDENGNWLV